MAPNVRTFVKLYLAVIAILLALSAVLSLLAHVAFLYVATILFLGIGFAYVVASTFAWTGFGNLYRVSPTLFLGSRTYRQQIVRGALWTEGRDNHALLVGLAFGGALMGVGAAMVDPLFILVDALGVAGAGLYLRFKRARTPARS